MAFRRPARLMAPLALLGAVAAILLVVASTHHGGSSGDSGSISDTSGTSTHSSGTSGSTTTGTTSSGAHATRHSYVVKPGDVLSGIAASTGVPLADIERLNPTVDAQSLHAGQKIKLAP